VTFRAKKEYQREENIMRKTNIKRQSESTEQAGSANAVSYFVRLPHELA